MKLTYSPPSPFARKVRVAAMELGLADEIELIQVQVVPGQPNQAYSRDINPLRKIPALTLDDGKVIYDSTVICDYLDARAGGGRLIPASGDDRWRVLTHHALAQGMCEAAVLIRYETWLRPDDIRWQTWIDDQWDRIFNGLERFEAEKVALDEPLNLAHITLGCLLGYIEFRYPETDWRGDVPALATWFDQIANRESFAATVPVQPGD